MGKLILGCFAAALGIHAQAQTQTPTAIGVSTPGLETPGPVFRVSMPHMSVTPLAPPSLAAPMDTAAATSGIVYTCAPNINALPGTVCNTLNTTIAGLPVGEYVEFCFRVATKTGEGDWSEPITVLVK